MALRHRAELEQPRRSRGYPRADPAGLRRAEDDHAGEVPDGLARRGIGERLIQLVEMGVAVHEQDRLSEPEREAAQGVAEPGESVGSLAPHLSLEIGIALSEDEDSREAALFRQLNAVLQPREHLGHARAMLGVHRGRPAEIVVAALHVDADEEHVARDPAYVFAVFLVPARLPLEAKAAEARLS